MNNDTAQLISRTVLWTLPFIIAIVGFAVRFAISRLLKTVDQLAVTVHEAARALAGMTVEVKNLKEVEQQHHAENLQRFGKHP